LNYSVSRKIISFILFYSGISWFFLKINKSPGIIHYYGHRILTPNSEINNFFIKSKHAISVKEFEKKIIFLKRNFNPINIDKIENENKYYSNFTISFDDGYVDNLITAYPIAKKYNIPIHIFITTDLILNKFTFWPDKLGLICSKLNGEYEIFNNIYSFKNEPEKINSYLNLCKIIKEFSLDKIDKSIKEIIKITDSKITQEELFSLYITPELIDKFKNKISFGAHTEKHENLTKLKAVELKKTINRSINILENILHQKVKTFAYPYGYYNSNVLNFINSKKPYLNCFSTGCGNTTTNFDIPRINLNISPFYLFHVETSGVFNWLKEKIN
jgi:peptidoglycan/xylan/chitin deacetylase (PgdA/CDA1 family)